MTCIRRTGVVALMAVIAFALSGLATSIGRGPVLGNAELGIHIGVSGFIPRVG